MGLFSSIFRKRERVKNPDGSKTVTVRDKYGNVRKVKNRDADGYKTKQRYDRAGDLTKRKAKGPGMGRYKAKRRNFQNVSDSEFQPGRPWPGGASKTNDWTKGTGLNRRSVPQSNMNSGYGMSRSGPPSGPPPPIPGMRGNPNVNPVYNANSTAYSNQNKDFNQEVTPGMQALTSVNQAVTPGAPSGLSPFEQAFKTARSEGKKEFTFKGKPYHTRYKEEMKVLGGRISKRKRGGALGRNKVL